MRPFSFITGPLAAASANCVFTSQTLIAAGNYTLNGANVSGGVATMDSGGFARPVLLTFAADETGKTFTVSGTVTPYGTEILTDTVAGTTPGTAATTAHFFTVTNIAVNLAPTGAVIAGTNGVGSSKPVIVDQYQDPTSIGLFFEMSSGATGNYSLQFTAHAFPETITPVWFTDSTVTGKSANFSYNLTQTCRAIRVLVNSGFTGTSSLRTVVTQATTFT